MLVNSNTIDYQLNSIVPLIVLRRQWKTDDKGAFSNSWEEHMALLSKILTLLQENGFTVNLRKCDWAIKETGWLGYWLTPMGLKSWKKKIDTVLQM